MAKAQTRLQTCIPTLFLSHQWFVVFDLHVFSETPPIRRMYLFIELFMLIVLIPWKHTVCTQMPKEYANCVLDVWQLFCLAGFRATEGDSTTKYTADLRLYQSLRHTNRLSTRHVCFWIQLCSLHSTAPREGSVMFQWPQRSSVFIPVFMKTVFISRRFCSVSWDLLLWYQANITPSGPHTVTHQSPVTYMFCWHERKRLNEPLRVLRE